jgi:hypothetical protein
LVSYFAQIVSLRTGSRSHGGDNADPKTPAAGTVTRVTYGLSACVNARTSRDLPRSARRTTTIFANGGRQTVTRVP